MLPFTASTSLFAHPGILNSLWTADMPTKSQHSVPFGATWSNPTIWGRSRATSVPAWQEEEEEKEERMGQLFSKGPCDWEGWDGRWYSQNGLSDTPGIWAVTPLGSLSSLFFRPGLQDECFPGSSCYWKEGGCSAFGFPVCTHLHREVHGCDSSAKKGRDNRSVPIDLKSITAVLTFSKGNIRAQTVACLELTTSLSPVCTKRHLTWGKNSCRAFFCLLCNFSVGKSVRLTF